MNFPSVSFHLLRFSFCPWRTELYLGLVFLSFLSHFLRSRCTYWYLSLRLFYLSFFCFYYQQLWFSLKQVKLGLSYVSFIWPMIKNKITPSIFMMIYLSSSSCSSKYFSSFLSFFLFLCLCFWPAGYFSSSFLGWFLEFLLVWDGFLVRGIFSYWSD